VTRLKSHAERHLVARIGWLRAAVLGANDGIVSTASLIVGVAAAAGGRSEVLVAGMAGLVAGAMSMAAGEYVSVSSQSDTERADLARETAELATDPEAEQRELAAIYVSRGLTPDLATQVATQLMSGDALAAHARDELGISEITQARPIQAALTSAATFSVGAAMPLLMVVLFPPASLTVAVSVASLAFLALLGAIGARAGGANIWKATAGGRFWGALAMAVAAGIGRLFGGMVWAGVRGEAVAQAFRPAIGRILDEPLDQMAAVGGDHPLRRQVVDIRGQLDPAQAPCARLGQDQRQRRRGVSLALLPRDYRVADVAQAGRRQVLGPVAPAKADRAAEVVVPDPADKARQAFGERAVGQRHGPAPRFGVVQTGEKSVRISGDLRQLFIGRRPAPHVVRRPAAFERGDIRR